MTYGRPANVPGYLEGILFSSLIIGMTLALIPIMYQKLCYVPCYSMLNTVILKNINIAFKGNIFTRLCTQPVHGNAITIPNVKNIDLYIFSPKV